ncbi:MAG: hypothetical protein JJU28_15275 [Cyclobacteriaceae bacterium]|nr:hypothetical protein [Cyclobacteriaceae bacterium]
MKKHFDLHRFYRLLRFEFYSNKWEYILLIPILIGALWMVLLLGMINAMGSTYHENNYIPIFIIGYLAAGIFFNTKSFGALKKRHSAITYLGLPASTFEKYFLHWFLRIFLFTLLYPFFFYASVNAFIPLFKSLAGLYVEYYNPKKGLPEIPVFHFELVQPKTGRFIGDFSAFFGAIFTLTVIQLGSIAFGKWNLLKTLLSVFILQVVIYYFIRFIGFLKGGIEDLRPNFYTDGLPDHITWQEVSLVVLMAMTLIISWLATYLKLKEREV